MTVLYDTGVLIAAEANDRQVWSDHKARLQAGIEPLTTAPVVAQASRSPRQAQLHRLLRGCRIVAFDRDDAIPVGALLAATGSSDVVDGHLAVLASRSSATLRTDDIDDLTALSRHVEQPYVVRAVR